MFGLAFGYAEVSDDPPLATLFLDDDAFGMEVFYNAMIVPGVWLTGDIQVSDPSAGGVDTTVVAGLRLNVRF